MPTENTDALVERVRLSSEKLSAVATRLNAASDAMTRAVDSLDETLKQINLGLECWVWDYDGQIDEKGTYYEIAVGYWRIRSKWGIVIRQVMSEDEEFDLDRGDKEWLFKDAPRKFRITALSHIPGLVDSIIKEAEQIATAIERNIAATSILAEAVKPERAPKRDNTAGQLMADLGKSSELVKSR